jgi:hypothetical protein
MPHLPERHYEPDGDRQWEKARDNSGAAAMAALVSLAGADEDPHIRGRCISKRARPELSRCGHDRENYARRSLRGGKTGTARQVAWLFSPVD